MALDPRSERYLQAVAAILRDGLGEELLGVYLHGSGSLGDFDATRSDLDVLAVVRGGIPPEAKKRVADLLSAPSLPCPARGLELSIVTRETAANPTHRRSSSTSARPTGPRRSTEPATPATKTSWCISQ